MQKIDLDSWDRKEHFEAFRGWDFPYINVGANVDVTALIDFSRRHRLSSYLTLVHAAHRTANNIINFRYRIKDGEPVLLDTMALSFTYMPPGRELFINVAADYVDDVFTFHRLAKEKAVNQGTNLGLAEVCGRLDIIMYSALPWIQYTHMVRTLVRAGQDSNPKMTWGKYFAHEGRTLTPFSVQVHHGLMDGFHIGKYYRELQRYINGLE